MREYCSPQCTNHRIEAQVLVSSTFSLPCSNERNSLLSLDTAGSAPSCHFMLLPVMSFPADYMLFITILLRGGYYCAIELSRAMFSHASDQLKMACLGVSRR